MLNPLLYLVCCCRCDYKSFNPAAGGTCQPCSVANSVANDERTACVCAPGFTTVLHPTAGMLTKCVAAGLDAVCSAMPNAVVNFVGDACMCAAGFTPQYGGNQSLVSCSKQLVAAAAADNVTAVSGAWATFRVLDNDGGTALRITAVSRPLQGGRAVVLANATGADSVAYLSKDGFTGTDIFSYTTAQGNATVTVAVTAGSCLGSSCGLLGSCSNGVCRCAEASGMQPVFAANPSTALRAAVPRIPACRYPGEPLQGFQGCVTACQCIRHSCPGDVHDDANRQ
jgi:hypothetical protein